MPVCRGVTDYYPTSAYVSPRCESIISSVTPRASMEAKQAVRAAITAVVWMSESLRSRPRSIRPPLR